MGKTKCANENKTGGPFLTIKIGSSQGKMLSCGSSKKSPILVDREVRKDWVDRMMK